MKDEDCEARAQAHLASLKRDMKASMEDAVVRAMHKVMAEFEAKSDERLMEDWGPGPHEHYSLPARGAEQKPVALPEKIYEFVPTPEPAKWHHPECEGECIACLIERVVQEAYGSQGLSYLQRHLTSSPAQQEPVAVVSGYYGGQCVILPIDPARIFNSNTALYTTPQPPAQQPTQQEPLFKPLIDLHPGLAEELKAINAPAQRKPLDAGEISRLWKQNTSEDGPHHNPYDDDGLGFARAIESAHGIKGDA